MLKIPLKKNKHTEADAQTALSTYIKLRYPDVIFTSESSGMKVTMGQAVKMKKNRSEGKLPDFIILEARGGWNGLILELKKTGFDLGKALDVNMVGDRHAKGQHKMLLRLRDKGYCSSFVVGFDHAKVFVDKYMAHAITEIK